MCAVKLLPERYLSGAIFGGQQPRIDSRRLERGRPARVDVAGVEQRFVAGSGEPAVPGELLLELVRAPAGIAQRRDPAARPLPFRDRLQDVDRAGEHPALADIEALAAPS